MIKWVLIYCKVKHIMRVSILCTVYPHARSFNVDLLNIFVMLQKLRNLNFHACHSSYLYFKLLNLPIPHLCRLFSWVQQKLLSIGSTGCLHSLSMQSKTQSLENGSISNVPLFLMMNWEWGGANEKLESTARLKDLLGIYWKETDGCLWTNHIVFRLKVHYAAA